MPRVSDSATFSAACRQTEQVRNRPSPSFHSLVCRSKMRGVDATRNFATAAPDGGEAQLGVVDEIADDRDDGLACHG